MHSRTCSAGQACFGGVLDEDRHEVPDLAPIQGLVFLPHGLFDAGARKVGKPFRQAVDDVPDGLQFLVSVHSPSFAPAVPAGQGSPGLLGIVAAPVCGKRLLGEFSQHVRGIRVAGGRQSPKLGEVFLLGCEFD